METINSDIAATLEHLQDELFQSYSDPVMVEVMRRAIALLETRDLGCHLLLLLQK